MGSEAEDRGAGSPDASNGVASLPGEVTNNSLPFDEIDTSTNHRRYGGEPTAGVTEASRGILYEKWVTKELRDECTARGISVPHGTKKASRIALLRAHDENFPTYMEMRGLPRPSPEPSSTIRRTKHCMFRLLDLLFTDEFSMSFAESGNNATRDQLDGGETPSTVFWRSVAAAYSTERGDIAALVFDDAGFKEQKINPGIVIAHSADRLKTMWGDVNRDYKVTLAKCTQSGNQEDFPSYVNGQMDVLYLWRHLQVKPQLNSFVQGGLLEDDELDTLELQLHPEPAKTYESVLSTPGKRKTPEKSRTTPPSKRKASPAKRWSPSMGVTKQTGKANFAVASLSKSVEVYLARQQAFSEQVIQQVSQSRPSRMSMLDDLESLRTRIARARQELKDATDDLKGILEEDLAILIEERSTLVKKFSGGATD